LRHPQRTVLLRSEEEMKGYPEDVETEAMVFDLRSIFLFFARSPGEKGNSFIRKLKKTVRLLPC